MYGKVFESMFDGTLASRGPWQALVTFQQMIVLADKDGVVDMTAEAISRRTSIPLDIIEVGVKALMLPDNRSRTADEEGRRIIYLEDHRDWGWQIVNHAKYQAIRSAEERREYLRIAQANRRARLKGLSTPVNTVNQPSTLSTPVPVDESEATQKPKKSAFALPGWVPAPQWIEFEEHRKAMRGVPFTNAARVGVIRDLEALRDAGYDPAGRLTEAVTRGWRTVFAPKTNGKQAALESNNARVARELAKRFSDEQQ